MSFGMSWSSGRLGLPRTSGRFSRFRCPIPAMMFGLMSCSGGRGPGGRILGQITVSVTPIINRLWIPPRSCCTKLLRDFRLGRSHRGFSSCLEREAYSRTRGSTSWRTRCGSLARRLWLLFVLLISMRVFILGFSALCNRVALRIIVLDISYIIRVVQGR